MTASVRLTLIIVDAVALVWLAIKAIIPLVIMYSAGVGRIPVPRALARKYPVAAIVLFTIFAPFLFAVLFGGLVYLVIHR